MKHILIFSTAYFPLVGGAEVAMKEITDRITDIRFDLICAKIRPGLLSKEQIGNVTVHRVGFGHPIDKFLLPVLGTFRALRLEKPDAIWSLMASFGGFAALTYTWLRPSTKLLLTLQEGDPLEHYDRRVGSLRFLHRMIFRRADAIQAISHFLADWAKKMGFQGIPEVVPNGVDIARFTDPSSKTMGRTDVRSQYGFTESDTVLVTASRLSHKNGVDDLIQSLTHLSPSYKALIAGEGEDAQKLKALVAKNGLESRVVFAGSVSHRDLPAVLSAGDIFVRASRSEGLGNAFLEAMAVGLPVIGTPVGGIPDFLVDGVTGVFCQPNDPASIAIAVERIISDATLRAHLIQNGERLVREQYDWDGIAKRMREILHYLVALAPRSSL